MTSPTDTGIAALFGLQNKCAVVTGGGAGIGKSVAQLLVAAGARVVVADVNVAAAFTVAGARVILLDTRSERVEGKTLLGRSQLAWFLDELERSVVRAGEHETALPRRDDQSGVLPRGAGEESLGRLLGMALLQTSDRFGIERDEAAR